jgi:hypothetical protein
MPHIHITDLPPMPAFGADLTAQQMKNIRGGAGEPIPVEPDGGIGSGPNLPFPGFPQLPGLGGTPGFCGTPAPVPVLPGCYTRDRIPGPAESPVVF